MNKRLVAKDNVECKTYPWKTLLLLIYNYSISDTTEIVRLDLKIITQVKDRLNIGTSYK